MITVDFTIVGGGITGLILARDLKKMYPTKEVVLLEKEQFCGDHTSGRNSGVIHSGLYYETNSDKHKFCLEGNKLWRELCSELGISLNECGKFIFASSSQKEEFEALKIQADSNQVESRLASHDEIAEINKYAFADTAIYIPSTAMLCTSSAIKALEHECEKSEAHILRNTCVTKLISSDDSFEIHSNEDPFKSKFLFNCAGLGAIELRKMLGFTDLENNFVRGTYIKTYQDYYKKSLLYPVPQKNLKGLGIHTTFDQEGVLRFGPDTEDIAGVNYQINEDNCQKMLREIPTLFKDVELDRLQPDYCGIRPKIMHNGKRHKDFWVKTDKETGLRGYFEMAGIESPGLTASPALSKHFLNAINCETI